MKKLTIRQKLNVIENTYRIPEPVKSCQDCVNFEDRGIRTVCVLKSRSKAYIRDVEPFGLCDLFEKVEDVK